MDLRAIQRRVEDESSKGRSLDGECKAHPLQASGNGVERVLHYTVEFMSTAPRKRTGVSELHAAWEETHSDLRKLEQILSEAIQLYAKGHGARPDNLIEQVTALRSECSARFQALMAAMKE